MTLANKEGMSILYQEKKSDILTRIPPKKVILLAGPTASGKTKLSLQLARALKGEIVSADSMQVYRGMDIGTAKVSEEDQSAIPHHLIDIRHIEESFNVVDFYYEAKKSIDSILARNRVPIVVGGTGFYFRALLHDPPQGPPSLPYIRHELETEMEKRGEEALFEKLQTLDPSYASSITHKDKHKIIRALEIITITGEKVSKFTWNRNTIASDYTFFPWFLYRPRQVLYERIDKRCDEMLEEGLIEEVENLLTQGLLTNSSASQAIGYRQVIEYLQSPKTPTDFETLQREFKTASRHYAKRQFTWFRKEPLFRWLNIDAHDFEIALDMIIRDFETLR